MAATAQLDYNHRFGAGVTAIASKARADAAMQTRPQPQEGGSITSRWLLGDEQAAAPQAQALPKIRPIDFARMAATEIAQVTLGNLGILGDENFGKFASSLPAGHKLRKEIRPSLINKNGTPWLGSCKIGQIVTGVQNGHRSVQQFFIGNFDAEIDTSGKGELYRLKNKEFDQTFYSLHMLLDAEGKFKGFDKTRGSDGVAFHTNDLVEAHYAIASAATGFTVEQLKEMARQNRMRRAA